MYVVSTVIDLVLCVLIKAETEMSKHIRGFVGHTWRLKLKLLANMTLWWRIYVTKCRSNIQRTGRLWILTIVNKVWLMISNYHRWRSQIKCRWRKRITAGDENGIIVGDKNGIIVGDEKCHIESHLKKTLPPEVNDQIKE